MAIDPPVDPADPDDTAGPPVLACGHDAAAVWERAVAGIPPDAHERDCPHCTAVRADAAGLGVMVAHMADQHLEPPPNVLDRVMTAVRSELRPHELLLLDSPAGPAHLSRVAAATVLRGVVDRMGGMRARSCRITQTGYTVDVAITVTARFGVDLASVAARVRQMVRTAGEQALGVPVRRVDIEVVDVFEETP